MADSEIQAFGTFTVQELTYMGKKNPIVELAEEQVPQTNNTAKGRFGFAVNVSSSGWWFLPKTAEVNDAHAVILRRQTTLIPVFSTYIRVRQASLI